MKGKPTPAEIVIMASGAVALIFSFFDYFSYDDFGGNSIGLSAWSSGLFPLATYIAIIGVILGVQVAVKNFASVSIPERVLGFTWQQIHLVLAVFATLISIGYLIMETPGLGIGFWLMFIASIGMLVGAILEMNESKAATS